MVYQIYVTAHAAEGAKKLHPDIRKDIYELFSELVLNGSVPFRGFIESRQRDNVNE